MPFYHTRAGTSLLGRVSLIALVAFAATPALAQTNEMPVDEASSGLEEIVVTAQKREENLQSVPVAITALSSESLQRMRVVNVGGLGAIVPNFTVIRQPSNVALPAFSLRGVLAGESQPQIDNGVSIYVDGVYLGRSSGSLFDVADIERMEVLRGPQGTLFGRNTTGGAVNIITRTPPGSFGIRQDVSFGNFNEFSSRTRVDLPALGPFAASVTYLHREMDGYVENLSAGTIRNYGPATGGLIGQSVAASTLGAENVDSVFAAVNFDNGGPLTADYKFDWTDFKGSQLGVQMIGFRGPNDPPGTTGLVDTVKFLLSLQPALGGTNVVTSEPLDALHDPQRSTDSLRASGHSLTLNYEISDAVTLKNISAYRKLLVHSNGNSFDGNRLVDPFGGTGRDFTILNAVSRRPQNQISNELQLTVDTERFNFIAGAFYFKERARNYNPVFFFQTFPPADEPITIGPADQFSDVSVRNTSYALFAQGGYEVLDGLTLTAGVRQTWDERREDNFRFGSGPTITSEVSFDKLTWTAIAEYEATPEVMLYGKVATGYLSGGVFNGVSFDPENLTSYEVGFKGDFLNDMLRLNIAAFLANYDDLQVSVFTGVLTYENAGKARIKGLEAEATFAPSRNLRISANLGLLDFDYREYQSSALTGTPMDVLDIAVRPLTPKVTFTPSLFWESQEFESGARATFSLDVPYRSEVKYAVWQIADPQLDRDATSQAHWLVNARVSLQDIPIGRTQARISLYGQNLFNKRVVQHAADIGGFFGASYNRPRSYGIETSIEF